MAVLPIVLYPDPILLTPTETVDEVDETIRRLVADMTETMYRAPGIGLAANQVGLSMRLCIVDLTAGDEPGQLKVFVNPRIVAEEGREVGEEGCLSFPDVTVDVERAARITVEALDADGRPFSMDAEGMLARAIQHECEHLDGQVFLRNVSPLKRGLIKKRIQKRIRAGDWFAA